MDAASYWLSEKALVHKLFKVLVPRYENHQSAYTSLFKAPLAYPKTFRATSVLELKGSLIHSRNEQFFVKKGIRHFFFEQFQKVS